ncbi:hypothetical protein [Burkholderia sp. BCC1972]|uniref:hypothetical protein n=1 Tax=Burkholderia sp. BCC1972 TaxID=2817438 RepID=UPI002ABE2EE0|nr:hypothetical protein [Burkholderia sp. BCC1972]
MSKYAPTIQLDGEKIVTVMEPGVRYSATALSAATRISISRVTPALAYLIDVHRVVCHVTRQRHQYVLREADGTHKESKLVCASRPHLTGYDQQMRRFVDLCMLARPPVAIASPHDATEAPSVSPNPSETC